MAIRNKRTIPRSLLGKIRVTERDVWLLEGLAKMRFLTTSQLAKLYFNGSQWYPNKRLRNLLDAGLVKAWVRSLATENVYSITRSGIAAIEDRDTTLALKTTMPYGLDENLTHLLAINDVRISLVLTLSGSGEILWWRSDWDLRSHGRDRIIPDGLFLLKWNAVKDQAYALEVDNNTRSSKNFLKKILAYINSRAVGGKIYGLEAPIILVAGSDPKWLERYRASVKEIRLSRQVWFATLEDIADEGATGTVWVNEEGERYSLRELTFCPYRKDGFPSQSASV